MQRPNHRKREIVFVERAGDGEKPRHAALPIERRAERLGEHEIELGGRPRFEAEHGSAQEPHRPDARTVLVAAHTRRKSVAASKR